MPVHSGIPYVLVGTQSHDYVRHRNQEPITLADMTAEGCEHEYILLIGMNIEIWQKRLPFPD